MARPAFDVAAALQGAWKPSGEDWTRKDGWRLRVRTRCPGFRELRAGLFELAQLALAEPALRRAVLVAWMPGVGRSRLAPEWEALGRMLRPELLKRLGLVVLAPGWTWTPEDPALVELAGRLKPAFVAAPAPGPRPKALTPKVLEVVKVLLVHFLRGDGFIRISQLIAESGATYPPVREALRRLESRGELARSSGRHVALSAFPAQTWQELLTLRHTLHFVDGTGRGLDPARLKNRVGSLKIPNLALGGVIAARHWDPNFDLNGLPRLDLVVQDAELGWLPRLDPALRPRGSPTERAVLAVHVLGRPQPLFTHDGGRLLADPVETLLDLHELRLVEQAGALVAKLQKK